MRKLAILAFAAALALPAAAIADNPPGQIQGPAQQCKAQRTSVGVSAFNQLYGSGPNAFGKCVSHQTQADSQAESDAATACKAEQAANAGAFTTKYGHGNGHNAFGKCVSQKSQSAEAQSQQATINAA